jgi:hypothetical protein
MSWSTPSSGVGLAHTPDSPPIPSRAARRLAALGVAGLGCFVLLEAVLHVLQSDFDPLSRTVSEYAHGRYGWLTQVASFGLGAGSLAVVAALNRATRPVPSRSGTVLLVVWSAAVMVAAVFPSDLIDLTTETRLSVSGAVHTLAVLVALPSFAVGAPLLTRGLRQCPGWRPFIRPVEVLAVISVVGLAAFVVTAILTATGATRALLGLGERILLASYLGWLLVVALRCATGWRTGGGSSDGPPR